MFASSHGSLNWLLMALHSIQLVQLPNATDYHPLCGTAPTDELIEPRLDEPYEDGLWYHEVQGHSQELCAFFTA